MNSRFILERGNKHSGWKALGLATILAVTSINFTGHRIKINVPPSSPITITQELPSSIGEVNEK